MAPGSNGFRRSLAWWVGLSLLACGADQSVLVVAPSSVESTALDSTEPRPLPSAAVSENGHEPLPDRESPPSSQPPAPSGPRFASVSHYAWIYKAPNRKNQPIGYVRPGTSAALSSAEPVSGSDCQSGRWLQVEPRGYVCDDAAITLDLDSPLFRALEDVVRPRDHVLPYRYAYSMGAPMYGRFPSEKEVSREAREYGPVPSLNQKGRYRSGYEELAVDEVLGPREEMPSFGLPELPRMRGYDAGLVRKKIPAGSLLSYGRAVEFEGRTYLLTPDLTWVPAERVKPFHETSFRGVSLGGDITLPIGWTRRAPRSKYRKTEDGGFEATQETWAPRSMLKLTGVTQAVRGLVYWEVREEGFWVRGSDVSVVEEIATLPPSVQEGEKWIEFSSSKGTLTLYVGKKAIYSTLASPGRGGGAPRSGMSIEDLVQGSFTPLGVYRITFKTRSTTMTPEGTPNPKKHWVQDVPYTLYFLRPFAIHAAYWHEDFGMPKSGGCINLSPVDARHVFEWTEPSVPEQWSGASSSPEMGLGTPLVLRR